MVNDVNEAGFPPAPRSFQRAANLTSAHLLSGGLLSHCLVAVLGSLDFSDPNCTSADESEAAAE